MKQLTSITLLILILSGCASFKPSTPVSPDGNTRTNVNNAAVISEITAQYYQQQALLRTKSAPPSESIQLTLAQVVDQYVPTNYRVYIDENVDLRQSIWYDPSKSWTESLGGALTNAGIEMTANLENKIMILKTGTWSINQVLQKYVPSDFTVFADKNVDLTKRIKYDRSKQWPEELGKALSAVDIHMIAHIEKKAIVLRPSPKVESFSLDIYDTPKIQLIQQ